MLSLFPSHGQTLRSGHGNAMPSCLWPVGQDQAADEIVERLQQVEISREEDANSRIRDDCLSLSVQYSQGNAVTLSAANCPMKTGPALRAPACTCCRLTASKAKRRKDREAAGALTGRMGGSARRSLKKEGQPLKRRTGACRHAET